MPCASEVPAPRPLPRTPLSAPPNICPPTAGSRWAALCHGGGPLPSSEPPWGPSLWGRGWGSPTGAGGWSLGSGWKAGEG